MRLVEDNPSSVSLLDIYKQRCAKKGLEHDNPIARYYEKLATIQARGAQASHQVIGRLVPTSLLGVWHRHKRRKYLADSYIVHVYSNL
jgi:transformation/transcription domain-associated protein